MQTPRKYVFLFGIRFGSASTEPNAVIRSRRILHRTTRDPNRSAGLPRRSRQGAALCSSAAVAATELARLIRRRRTFGTCRTRTKCDAGPYRVHNGTGADKRDDAKTTVGSKRARHMIQIHFLTQRSCKTSAPWPSPVLTTSGCWRSVSQRSSRNLQMCRPSLSSHLTLSFSAQINHPQQQA